jgi:diadenosine tetraphosphate (Ap4A) HIT family hydrolase
MEFSDWNDMRRGMRCPFDEPRSTSSHGWDTVGTLSVSTLYLGQNQSYLGHCLLVLDVRHATRPDELPAEEWLKFCADLYTAETAIVRTLDPDHVNIATLGNVVPHLHWHIIPRYRNDPRWGGPIWLTYESDMPDTRLDPSERDKLLRSLRSALTSARENSA